MFIKFNMLILIFMCISQTISYKPVFLIHGLNGNPRIFNNAIAWIEEAHPGTVIVPLDLFDNSRSFFGLWAQAEKFAEAIKNNSNYSNNGIHLIGMSQGGLLARAVVMLLGNHSILNLITLGAPHMGIYGTDPTHTNIPIFAKIFGYGIFYTRALQMTSVGNMWNDPHHQKKYLDSNTFLPILNNQVNHSRFLEFKESFLRLRKMVMIGGPEDEVISPWESSQFGFYDSNENVVPMKEQKIYIEDSFGLRTMDFQKRLYSFTVKNVTHINWPSTMSVVKNFVIPFLD